MACTADHADEYNYCVVPGSGQDAILFACAALVAAVALASRLSALWVLLAGAAAEVCVSAPLFLGNQPLSAQLMPTTGLQHTCRRMTLVGLSNETQGHRE
jgi:hypothetical protein